MIQNNVSSTGAWLEQQGLNKGVNFEGVGAAAWEVRRQYVARTETVAWVASYKLRWLNCRLHKTIRVKISSITFWFSEAKSLLTWHSRKNASPKTTVFRRHSKYRWDREIRESKEEKRKAMGWALPCFSFRSALAAPPSPPQYLTAHIF